METYFILHCLARSISSRVKHQIEHQPVKKAEHLYWKDQRVTGAFTGPSGAGAEPAGNNSKHAHSFCSTGYSIFKSKHSRNSM